MGTSSLAASLSRRFDDAYPVVKAGEAENHDKFVTATYNLMSAARAYGTQMTKGREGFDVNVAADMVTQLKDLKDIRFREVTQTLDEYVTLEIQHYV